jgi:hypothetical protein
MSHAQKAVFRASEKDGGQPLIGEHGSLLAAGFGVEVARNGLVVPLDCSPLTSFPSRGVELSHTNRS